MKSIRLDIYHQIPRCFWFSAKRTPVEYQRPQVRAAVEWSLRSRQGELAASHTYLLLSFGVRITLSLDRVTYNLIVQQIACDLSDQLYRPM
ncbi:hypothetical protein HanXRQr2_Chr14g0629471 [Helianthus annuus]|uniref:Uncharacterized protein n=1 Tax=Helianthus annuus TaxID=4232 RepID=A0A9K3H5B5_HELAN|nr:hypothetical protein HanXRQr2_Chr14g0629471 [Helianthus annuus]KAJ0839170.1 hypothetical protein HanPSC8_Chr14g0603721 [Helianthus annuus]